MRTNKFDINDLVALGEYEGRITEMQLSEGDLLYYINLDHGQGGWYDEKDLVLLENCPLENPFNKTTEAIWQSVAERNRAFDDSYRDALIYGTGIFKIAEDDDRTFQVKIIGGGGSQLQGLGGIGKIIVDEWNVGEPTECSHSWVDVGFMQSKVVCKHCNREQN